VNLNPDKACNFDCPYCQVDRRIPGGDRAIQIPLLEQELHQILERVDSGRLWETPPFDTAAPSLRTVRDIAIAGDGEPTAAREFPEAIDCLGRVCAARGVQISGAGDTGPGGIRLNLLTNATLLHRPRVAAGVEAFGALGGEIWAKLDAGTQAWFEIVDGTRLSLDRVVDNIGMAAARRPLLLQCMFMRWEGEGPDPVEIEAWGRRLEQILEAGGQLRLVQVYTLARAPADARASILPTAELERIAETAQRLGLAVEISPGVSWEA
jgi:wyosine [tRNA(Phe)-imidazoG37] synthetase (radical SAM superfamily)